MDKKTAFRQIIADFIEKPLVDTFSREIDVPQNVPKVVSLLGPRRAGKTHVLFHLIRELRKSVSPHRLVYLNFEIFIEIRGGKYGATHQHGQNFQRFEIKGMTAALQMLDLPAGRILTRDRKEEIKTANKTILVQPAWSYFFEKS
jgi:hypothetical protein